MRILFFISILLATPAYGVVELSKINLNCSPKKLCDDFHVNTENLLINYENLNDLRNGLKTILFNDSISRFSYKVYTYGSKYEVDLQVDLRKTISNVAITGFQDLNSSFLRSQLFTLEGSYLEEEQLTKSVDNLNKIFFEHGYPRAKVKYKVKELENSIDVKFILDLGAPVVVTGFDIHGDNPNYIEELKSKLKKFHKGRLNLPTIKTEIESYRDDLFKKGYVNSSIEIERLSMASVRGDEIHPSIEILSGRRFVFGFFGNKLFRKQELLVPIKKVVNKFKQDLSIVVFEQELNTYYEEIGIYNTIIKTFVREGTDKESNTTYYYFEIEEGRKRRVNFRTYLGNKFFSNEEIEDFFESESSELASRDFFDKKYYQKFSKILERNYLQKGFVFVNISDPLIQISDDGREASIIFKIKEGKQAIINSVNFSGIEESDQINIRELLTNKIEAPINTIGLGDDLKKIITYLKNKGYYYASFEGTGEEDFVVYNSTYQSVDLFFKLISGPKLKLRNIIISGNGKTRNKAIYREITISKGQVITPQNLDETRDNINSLGLFSLVDVRPLGSSTGSSATDILINLKERNFGSIELGPGYRSDLGFKFSIGAGYSNLTGMNRSVKVNGAVNHRVDNEGLDESKKKDLSGNELTGPSRRDGKKFLEYSGKITFSEPYTFNLPVSFHSSMTHARKRYYSVDAYVTKINSVFTKDFGKRFSTSLGYQLEQIKQFNGTSMQDEGEYRIGSINPGLSLDLRNSQVYPTFGALFKLSLEYASPAFLSQNDTYPNIHFYKIVSRNYFYLPVFDDYVLASSVSLGKQKNMANDLLYNGAGQLQYTDSGDPKTKGHIPSIKGFRLGGIDQVRGYSASEINKLIGEAKSISDVLIQDEAYFLNVNVEPRYQMSESVVVGLFLDAGRVYLGGIRPEKMRTSTGITFKYLTAVGTVDFNWGFKLNRRTDLGEGVGRFHFSIGVF